MRNWIIIGTYKTIWITIKIKIGVSRHFLFQAFYDFVIQLPILCYRCQIVSILSRCARMSRLILPDIRFMRVKYMLEFALNSNN